MLNDLLNPKNYQCYNVTLAQLIGLESAIYVETLIELAGNSKDFFEVNRTRVKQLTTFDKKKQEEVEKLLAKINFVTVDKHSGNIQLNLAVITTYMSTEDKALKTELGGVVKQENKKSKTEVIMDKLKANIVTSNDELRQAYYTWIEAVYPTKGLNSTAVAVAQNAVDTFSNHNLDKALELIEIATISCYKDMTWAISLYETKHKKDTKVNSNIVFSNTRVNNKPVLLSDEVF